MKSTRHSFTAGSVILMLSGVAHFFGQFGGGSNLQREAIYVLMKDNKGHSLGLTYTLWGVMQAWGIGFGVLLFFLGLQNLLTAAALAQDAAALRRAAASSAVCVVALVAMALAFQIAPPALLLGPAALCFIAAAI